MDSKEVLNLLNQLDLAFKLLNEQLDAYFLEVERKFLDSSN